VIAARDRLIHRLWDALGRMARSPLSVSNDELRALHADIERLTRAPVTLDFERCPRFVDAFYPCTQARGHEGECTYLSYTRSQIGRLVGRRR
jgi:hypothetical protein